MSGPKPGPTQQGVLQPPLDHTIRLMSGLKRVCENYSLQMSPAGTAENAPGCNPGVPPTLKWTINDSGQPTLGEIGLALDECHSVHVWSSSPRTDVLGHSQPSLRD